MTQFNNQIKLLSFKSKELFIDLHLMINIASTNAKCRETKLIILHQLIN